MPGKCDLKRCPRKCDAKRFHGAQFPRVSNDSRLADEVDGLVVADSASRTAKSRERDNESCAFLRPVDVGRIMANTAMAASSVAEGA
jgi:hypothetical protein